MVNLARHTTHFINHPYRKWENGDLRSWVAGAPCGEGWVVRVRDRFGDYGVSGALTFAVTSRTMQVGLLFLTCPVLGRQVEYAFLSWVAQLAEARGAELIEIPFVRGRDNQDIENLLQRWAVSPAIETVKQGGFLLPVAELAEKIAAEAPNPEIVPAIVSGLPGKPMALSARR